MNKLFLVILTLILSGCASPDPITVVEYRNQLQHPEVIPLPSPHGAKVRAITKERIIKGELPDRAYIGFSYPDWLEFSKWMHDYKAYTKSLQNAVNEYQKQDSRDSQLSTD